MALTLLLFIGVVALALVLVAAPLLFLGRGAKSTAPPSPREGSREHILFVDTANHDRSKTAEDLYEDDERYEVRSAGMADFATVALTPDLLLWADRVFVMEDDHRTAIRHRFPWLPIRDVQVLNIENYWPRGDPELVHLLLRRLKRFLGPPQKRRARTRIENWRDPDTEG
jgi:predicted protein tyrosine phosphatase